MTLKTKIRGIDKLKAKANRLPAQARAHIAEALEKAANIIVTDMKRGVPVDDGDLRDSIKWDKVPDTDGTAIQITAGDGDAYYASFVEFGTKGGSRKRKDASGSVTTYQHPGTRAQPFFFPAVRMNRTRTRRLISAGYRKAAKGFSDGE